MQKICQSRGEIPGQGVQQPQTYRINREVAREVRETVISTAKL